MTYTQTANRRGHGGGATQPRLRGRGHSLRDGAALLGVGGAVARTLTLAVGPRPQSSVPLTVGFTLCALAPYILGLRGPSPEDLYPAPHHPPLTSESLSGAPTLGRHLLASGLASVGPVWIKAS